MSEGESIPKTEASEFFSFLKGLGCKGEAAGSLFKPQKQRCSDIDIVIRERDWQSFFCVLMGISGQPPVPVEFYVCEDVFYEPLLSALRASRYEVIRGRLMKGLRFQKRRWEHVKED